MGLTDWLLPKDKIFFDLLEEESENVLRGVELLNNYVSQENSRRDEMKEIERRGDEIVHEIYEQLHTSFIAPIDHEDIGRLATLYDDVLDLTYAVANRIYLYKIDNQTEILRRFASITLEAAKLLHESFTFMKELKAEKILKMIIEVNRLEEEADDLLNESVATLFDGNDPIVTIKLKEIYETFEQVTDSCEDVATMLRDIVLKNG